MSDVVQLRSLRATLGVSREDLTRVANVSLGTVRNAEKGSMISERSAKQILKAVNHWLRHNKQPEIKKIDTLGISWK